MVQYFFDQNNNFQWASIAAIISFLALCSTSISIYLTNVQGKKNRKSNTLINLRIEEFKELKMESNDLVSIINNYINDRNFRNVIGVKSISPEDPIKKELSLHFNKIEGKLYRKDLYQGDFSIAISTCLIKLLHLTNTQELTDIMVIFMQAQKEYFQREYNDIDNKL
ncbi:hypothetical protein [Rummeliibacillus stabekisii]|uniref:hypothetical protein n=1 Tax=Rummeliibacillus stabekisii TaxID=241244 RepID=UPI00116D0FE6|nr:hypothetical protein [Rummeliibacillus stabekisii]MBB5171640.1 hypothetical protein [Rummeliibacillus stabekisii]GEL05487.1 hypothetical protein RST01_21140 [Rummeliibacillus stabekisii]